MRVRPCKKMTEWAMAFAAPEAPEAPMATQAANAKHKREVCRYWLQSRCQKGQSCEFLHAFNYDKMPMCALGDDCTTEGCPYKHPAAARPVCANYELGFCFMGRRCQHKHVVKGPEQLPAVSTYWTPEYAAEGRAEILKFCSTFRKRPCSYFEANSWCPYFDMCNFVHASKKASTTS